LPDAYERLLLDVMRGDSALFTRNDEVEAAWSVVEPILETWRTAEVPVHEYPAGTWGPQAADDLLGQDREWLAPEESNG
jgi:glucose-6-phosphate 1-dehydrogenase